MKSKSFIADAEKVIILLKDHDYRYAKSMPRFPHFYTLKKTWEKAREFERCASFIQRYGYEHTFGKITYRYISFGGLKYWTMGAPISETILINRAVDNPQELSEATKLEINGIDLYVK